MLIPMYLNKKFLAIIPARGGSKGLPGKNIRLLNGKPLIAWSILAAQKSKYLDTVIVSTDSESIATVARQLGVDVPFLRPAELATDTASSIDVILHAIDTLAASPTGETYDYIILLEPTSPLRTAADIDLAIEQLLSPHSPRGAEAIVSVAKAEAAHPQFHMKIGNDGFIEPFFSAEIKHVPRQKIVDTYFPEGTIYISSVPALRAKRAFYHDKTIPYVVQRYQQLEIDEEMDLVCAEALMKYKKDLYPQ